MQPQLIFVAIFMAAAVAYTVWMKKKAKQGIAAARPAFHAFFERTGYRYADLAAAPVEAQVDRAYHDAAHPNPQGGMDLHYVRNFYGLPVHYRSKAWTEQSLGKTTHFRSNQWDADLPAPPRVPMHIVDKSLASVVRRVGEAFTNQTRNFSPKCSQKVVTGIANVDDKFVVYGENPDAVRHVLTQNPALVQLLQNWAEVDLSITGQSAVLFDPDYKNLTAAMGGTVGSMAMMFDYGKRTELSIPVHDRVAELLATLSRAAA
jgi:hypothetical protein